MAGHKACVHSVFWLEDDCNIMQRRITSKAEHEDFPGQIVNRRRSNIDYLTKNWMILDRICVLW
jgi:hypothetical protein